MRPNTPHEAVIAAWLDEGPTRMTATERAAIADAAEALSQRRSPVLPWRGAVMGRPRLAAIAIAVVAVLLAAMALGSFAGRQRPTSLVWTPDGLSDPFPAPLRSEPWFGAPLVAAELSDVVEPRAPEGKAFVYVDPSGDPAPASVAIVDLVSIEFHADCWTGEGVCVWYRTASGLTPPFVDPRVDWFAYGADFDNDGDGRVDIRFGIDNQPGHTVRAWSTDLRSGETSYRIGVWPDHPRLWQVELPMADGEGDARDRGYAFLHPELTTTKGHFYVWSAVIRDGQIVAMDFAPDAGWLDSRPDDDESKWGGRP